MATPDIIVQVKGGTTKVISQPSGTATRLTQLGDVNTTGVTDGDVLTYVAANGDFEFQAQASASGADQFARDKANGAFAKANTANTTADAAFNKANTANVTGQAAFDKANTAIYTAAQIRANISNTTPILYDPTTGIVSLTTVPVAKGGTGQVSYSNGDLLIGNTISGGLDRANLTSGPGIIITNANGKITIDAAVGKTYYLEYGSASDVAPYHKLLSSPSSLAENTIVQAFTTISSFVLMKSFITEPGEPNVTLLPPGTYGRHIHATTGGNGHVAQLRIELYKYAANGLETLLRSADSPQFDAVNGVDLLSWNVTDPVGYPLVATDRLLMKMYGTRITGGSGTITITVYTQGTSRASYATTSILGISGSTVTSVAGRVGAVVLNTNDVTENAAGPYYFTAAKVRANISNTTPIRYDSTSGVISHADSGVTAKGYGTAALIPVFVVDAAGHITSVVNTGIVIDASGIGSGVLLVDRGGTGQGLSYANGQLLIGNTISGGLDKATIAQSAPVIVTNLKGSITISHARSGVVALDSYGSGAIIPVFAVDANGHITAVVNTAIAGLSTGVLTTGILPVARGGTGKDATGLANGQLLIGNTVNSGFDLATIAQSAPVIVVVDKGAITVSHARSGVTAATLGGSDRVIGYTVDANGHITATSNVAIALLDAAAVTTGALLVARGGTGQGAYTNGQILIGNTGSTGLDKATIAQSAPIIVTNLQGSITISHARTTVAPATYGSQALVPVFAVDANGHITSVTDTAIGGLGTDVLTTGILSVARGGTGKDATGLANGQLHIGNTVNSGFDLTTIAQTAPVIVVNGRGTITLSHASSGAVATTYGNATQIPMITVDAFGHITAVSNTTSASAGLPAATANGQTLIGNTVSGGFDVATIAQSAPVIVTNDKGTITLSHARSGVTAATYGSGSLIPVITVDANGHLTTVTTTAVSGGSLPAATANGQLLVGNTVSSSFDVYTPAQSAPIIVSVDKGTIVYSHARSGVTAATLGGSNRVIGYTVDANGHITATSNVAIDLLDAAAITTGTLVVARGGTGQGAYTNGQILIGNTGSTGLDKATIAQSAPIIITNLQGSITVSHARSGVVALDSYGSQSVIPVLAVDANGHLTAVVNTAIGGLGTGVLTTGILPVARGGTGKDATGIANGQLLIGNTVNSGFDLATIAQSAPVIVVVDKGAITVSHARSGVTAATLGGSNRVIGYTVDANGHITATSNVAIDLLDAAAVTTGIIQVARGGTGKDATGLANGQLLIANTVNSGFDLAVIAQTDPVIVTVDKGSIRVSHARSGVTAATLGGSNRVIGYTVDANGHITATSNVAIDLLPAASITTGILSVARGGTGKDATGIANGQLLIGNTVNSGFDLATIAQSAPIIVTIPGKGAITLSHARSGVVAVDSYGSQAIIPVFAVDANGHLTAVVNTAIGGLATTVLTTGILSVARGGTGKDATGIANGQLLIGNTVNSGFDLATIAQSAPIIVTIPGKGAITLSHARSGVTATTVGAASLIPVITVDDNGHITAISTIAAAAGGLPPATANGQLLIGNTVSGSWDVNTLTQGSGMTITNDKGSITLSSTGGGSNGFGIIQINSLGAAGANVYAEGPNTAFTLIAGNNVVIVGDDTGNTVTISVPVGIMYAGYNGLFNP